MWCYGYWHKWHVAELRKVEHALIKITENFCDGQAGRPVRQNFTGPTLGTIL